MVSLQQLNTAAHADFVATLSGIFEHTPWVAERAWALRPFASTLDLHAAMCATVAAASPVEQLDLIGAHPQLAGRAAVRKELSAESTREQRGAGLDACSPDEYAQLQKFNQVYKSKFGFPFILAVRGHDRASIIATLETRIANDPAAEQHIALEQIGRIAAFRLAERIDAPLGTEIMAMHERLAAFSDASDALTCTYLRPAHRATAAAISDFMLAAGLDLEIDAVGNVVGRWRSARPDAKTLMTGSHYDTVINGGKYDGRLGILLPIAVAQQLRRSGVVLPFHLEIVAFAEEEGVRFKSTFLGSAAVAGRFDYAVLDNLDADGINMRQAMLDAGADPTNTATQIEAQIATLARDPTTLAGYVEVHIEQGPVLLDEGHAVGVVTAIAGSVRMSVTILGLAGHAGTVPMPLRRDAATAAAEIVLAVERCASANAGLVGTVGRLEVPGGAINVIPGRCELSIDIRSGDDALRDAAVADVLAQIERIATQRRVQIDVKRVLEAPSAPCALEMQQQLAAAITCVCGTPTARHLASGAGHDAMKMAAITPIGMLFVRCGNGGISHHPDETMTADDADIAARVFGDFLLNFRCA